MKLFRLLSPVACLLFSTALHAADKPLAKVTVQLDWVAEPEHGGLYQALARGFFRDEGLDVILLPGGPANICRLDPARYATQIAQLEDLGILAKGKVTAATAMTTDFLP